MYRPPISRVWSSVLSCIPAITLGLGAAIPFIYWALRLRNRRFVGLGVAYGVVACTCLVLLIGSTSSNGWEATLAGITMLTLACVATAHAFVVRHEILGEILGPRQAPWSNEPERKAKERINRREYARELLRCDPLLAHELRIGRPDLPRDFDDGGLIDVNHASAAAIAQLPEINAELAARIVSARATVSGFSSVDDMSVVLGCPPQIFDNLRDFFVYVS